MNWEAVFFDFDGVILDSVDVKTKAFGRMFREYGPEVEKKVIEYHLKNGGVSRFVKFRYYYEAILHQPVDEKTITSLSEQFSNLVVDGVLASPFISGAKETLEALREKDTAAYIVSGTPDREIKLIIERKGLSQYFKEIHGSPRKKQEICQEIISRENYNSQNCLFIGDAMSDYKAAQKNGVCFLGIVKEDTVSPFPHDTPFSSTVTVRWFP